MFLFSSKEHTERVAIVHSLIFAKATAAAVAMPARLPFEFKIRLSAWCAGGSRGLLVGMGILLIHARWLYNIYILVLEPHAPWRSYDQKANYTADCATQ